MSQWHSPLEKSGEQSRSVEFVSCRLIPPSLSCLQRKKGKEQNKTNEKKKTQPAEIRTSSPSIFTAAWVIKNPERQFKNGHKTFPKKYKITGREGIKYRNKQPEVPSRLLRSERGKSKQDELKGKHSNMSLRQDLSLSLFQTLRSPHAELIHVKASKSKPHPHYKKYPTNQSNEWLDPLHSIWTRLPVSNI